LQPSLTPPPGYVFAIDPATPGTLRDASGNPLTAASFGVQVADLYNPAGTLVASQATGILRGKWLGPGAGETGFLWLPGVSANFASLPGSTAADFGSGEFAITVKLKLATLVTQAIAGNWLSPTGITFELNGSTPRIIINASVAFSATVALGSAPEWIRVRRVGTALKFETSPDGSAWTQLGADVACATAIAASTQQFRIGTRPGGGIEMTARVYRVIVNKAGTDTIDIDFTNPSFPHGADSFVCATGQTVTINRSGADSACLIRGGVLCLDGVDDRWDLTSTIAAGTPRSEGAFLARHGTMVTTLGGATASLHYGLYGDATGLYMSTSAEYFTAPMLTAAGAVITATCGSTVASEKNGVTQSTTRTAASGSVTLAYLGRQGAAYASGQIGRQAYYTRSLDAMERKQLAQWIAEPYGITIP
jgi:hypothetical protein